MSATGGKGLLNGAGAMVAGTPSLSGLAEAMGVFYNLTGDVPCYEPTRQPPWAAIQPLCGFMMCREQPLLTPDSSHLTA